MAMRDEAWAALNRGSYDEAEQLFQQLLDREPETALAGLGRLYLLQGRGSQAVAVAETLLDTNQSPVTLGLYAEALGAVGRRKDAEDWLRMALEEAPRDGHLRVLLGEQRIRRGRWDEGASEIIAGLGMANRDKGFAHLKQVLSDLCEAVAANKVRDDDAQRFVNKIDYNIAGKTQDMAAFFGAVRRSLNLKQPLPGEMVRPQPASPGRPGPRPESSRPDRDRSNRAPTPPSQPERTHQRPNQRAKKTSREYSLAPDSPAVPRRSRQSPEPELLSLIRHDRSLNEALQADIDPIQLPVWPSKNQALDPIPALRPQLLGYDGNPIKDAKLHMTNGSVDSEIEINRAVVSLLAAAARGSARAPGFTLRGLTQLEIQCWDGLLENLPPVPDVYGEGIEIEPKELALGSFVGRCATLGEAVWRFADQPTDSTISYGKTVVQPFKVARAWLQADDPDDVYLEEPVEVMDSADKGTVFHLQAVTDDSTFELTEKALHLRLAELWMSFRSHSPEVSQVDVASDIQVIDDHEDFIVFGLNQAWAPPKARGPRGTSKVSGQHVPIAFVRDTGTFLVLASRKHFGRLLEVAIGKLGPENAAEVLSMVQRYHRNGANVVRNDDALSRNRSGGARLQFEIHTDVGVEERAIVYDPHDPIPWRFL